jgi:hypothetical protein
MCHSPPRSGWATATCLHPHEQRNPRDHWVFISIGDPPMDVPNGAGSRLPPGRIDADRGSHTDTRAPGDPGNPLAGMTIVVDNGVDGADIPEPEHEKRPAPYGVSPLGG